MQTTFRTLVHGTIAIGVTIAAGVLLGSPAWVPVAMAADAVSVQQQNRLVQKHCAVCHNDAARNGGLSLEGFDTAQAAPSLAAMMLSKLTSGVPLDVVRSAASNAAAAALVAQKLKGGAINAAGIPIPDMAALQALTTALAAQATGAADWHVNRRQSTATVVTASILRELPVARPTGEAASYRLSLACNAATQQGEMQLAWSPAPKTGILSVAVDGMTPLTYKAEGSERMGDGSKATPAGPAAIDLSPIPWPARTLTISNLFPNETVVFPFGNLPRSARQALSTCFAETR